MKKGWTKKESGPQHVPDSPIIESCAWGKTDLAHRVKNIKDTADA